MHTSLICYNKITWQTEIFKNFDDINGFQRIHRGLGDQAVLNKTVRAVARFQKNINIQNILQEINHSIICSSCLSRKYIEHHTFIIYMLSTDEASLNQNGKFSYNSNQCSLNVVQEL